MSRSFPRLASVLLSAGLLLGGTALAQSPKKGTPSTTTQTTKPAAKPGAKQAQQSAQKRPNYKRIKVGRIGEFKPVWKSGRDIQDTISGLELGIDGIRASLKTTAGVAQEQPLRSAFNTMRQQAGNNLQMTVKDNGMPEVSAIEATDDVLAIALAVNQGVVSTMGIVTQAKAFPAQIKTLLERAQVLPSKLSPDLLSRNGLQADDLQQQAMVVQHNVLAIIETKDRVMGLISAGERIVELTRSLVPTSRGGTGATGGKPTKPTSKDATKPATSSSEKK